jgi:DNA mismatch endonuclease (patch repair protein)
MQSNRSRDTRPEVALRSGLHAAGLRFRKHYRPVKGSRCEVDVAFTRWRVAVLLDGCFWHGCPQHATRPATNEEWWASKLDANVARDRRTDEMLAEAGWTVLRFWEHQPTGEVVTKVSEVISDLSVGVHRPATRSAGTRECS